MSLSKGTEQGVAWRVRAGPRFLECAKGSHVALRVAGPPTGWAGRQDLLSGCSRHLSSRPGGGQEDTKSWGFWEATFPVFLGSLGPWDP